MLDIQREFIPEEVQYFTFTNASDEDWATEWDSKIYSFPAMKTVPLIIRNETLENIQEIRKKFAKRFAMDQFLKSDEYSRLVGMTKNAVPPTFDEKVLTPWIQQCLTELPVDKLKTAPSPKDSEDNYTPNTVVMEQKDKEDGLSRDVIEAKVKERKARAKALA